MEKRFEIEFARANTALEVSFVPGDVHRPSVSFLFSGGVGEIVFHHTVSSFTVLFDFRIFDEFGNESGRFSKYILPEERELELARRARIERKRTLDHERFGGDLRTCRTCSNLDTNGFCLAAKRGKLAQVARKYRPPPDRLYRCEGYSPNDFDPDQRPGRERWKLRL